MTVVVSRGDTLTEIGAKLQEAGVVLSAESFVNAASVDERAGSIGPGRYTMRKQMNSIEALDLMLDPASRADSRLVLPEGLRLEQTVAIAAEATSLPKADFQKVLQEPEQLDLPDFAKDRPEGFMFPATYDLTGEETAKGLLRQLVKRFDQASADVGLEERAAEVGLTPYQVLIVASLLQAEVAPGDFAKAARVIYNRLDQDMPLQLDSTVSYALGLTDIQLNEEQLKTSSPYNTYVRRGLPPRPINSPGEAAMEAALNPAKGKWLYFVSVDPRTNETKFAKSYDKFLELQARVPGEPRRVRAGAAQGDRARMAEPRTGRPCWARRSPTPCRRPCTGPRTRASGLDWTYEAIEVDEAGAGRLPRRARRLVGRAVADDAPQGGGGPAAGRRRPDRACPALGEHRAARSAAAGGARTPTSTG